MTVRGIEPKQPTEVGPIFRKGNPPSVLVEAAVLPIDKPAGWTSFDVIRRLRRILGIRKIGHAGTLDPMATGLLICCAGRATKQVNHFVGLSKTYLGTLRLGETTASYDAETEIMSHADWSLVTDDQVQAAAVRLTGVLMQKPPMYSAVKVDGERLYKKARRGEVVERKPREITVGRFDVLNRTGSDVTFEVRCSKGTYIRALAHDLGQDLGCGAHLIALRRTAIGEHTVDRAWDLDELATCLSP